MSENTRLKLKISESRSVTSTIMTPQNANGIGNIHGGEIIKIMDTTAGIAGVRHSFGNVVTARIDELTFITPIHIGDIVECVAEVVYAGRTSMQVLVTVDVCSYISTSGKSETRVRALSAYFTMVAVDSNGSPREVPEVVAETEIDIKKYEEGQIRYIKQKSKK